MGDGPVEEFADSESLAAIGRSLVRHAWGRYRIGVADAEDLLQSALATYIQIRHRFPKPVDDRALVFGIFRKKCLEHIDRSVREQRRLRKMCESPDVARENP